MADSTTNLPTLSVNQAQKEVVQNAINDAVSPATYWGRDYRTTGGLTWGYLGGVVFASGSPSGLTRRPNGTVFLTPSATNYIEVDEDGEVTVNTVGFSFGTVQPLYEIFTNASAVTLYRDWRRINAAGGATGSITFTAQTGLVVTGSPAALGGTVDIQTPLIAKGDLLVVRQIPGSPTALVLERLPVGPDLEVLTSDSTQERGMQWAPSDVTAGGVGIIFPEVISPAGPPPVGSPPTTGMYGIVWNEGLKRPSLVDGNDVVHMLGEKHAKRIVEIIHQPGTTENISGVSISDISTPTTTQTFAGTRYTSTFKRRRTSTAAINTNTGFIITSGLAMFRGSSADCGGFFARYIWGYGALNANSKSVVGVTTSATGFSTTLEPSANLTNGAWFVFDSGDANWQVFHNDAGAGTGTKIDLGASFPRPTVEVSLYDGMIWCEPGSAVMRYRIQRLDDPAQVASGTISTNVMSANADIQGHFYANTGSTTAVAVSIDLFRAYYECRIF